MKKGFTLIELLAVIVILAIIALIATPIVLNIITDTKRSAVVRSAEFYLDALENAILLEKMQKDVSFSPNICVVELGNVSCDGKKLDVKTDGEFPSDGSIVTYEKGKLISVELSYKNGNISMNSQGELYIKTEKDEEPKEESICKLINDVSPTGISIGDKYQCKVKDDMEEGFEDGYYFFVLSQESNGTTNLIMERNIYYDEYFDRGYVATSTNVGLVGWYETDDIFYGPVTAMDYLHNATKDWNNIPNMIMNYVDENSGYSGIKTTNTITIISNKNGEETARIENLKARLPRFDEVHGEGKCLTYEDNGYRYGSCPLWLVNYLENDSYLSGDGLQNISGIYGYWLLSSNGCWTDMWAIDYCTAWAVDYQANLRHSYVSIGTANGEGIRPVINLKI